MTKILCTLILLFYCQAAISSSFDLSVLSEAHETFPALTEEAQEIASGSEIEFSAGLQKDLHRIKIILYADFTSFWETFEPVEGIPIEPREIIPNLSIAKIIYPFHSFP